MYRGAQSCQSVSGAAWVLAGPLELEVGELGLALCVKRTVSWSNFVLGLSVDVDVARAAKFRAESRGRTSESRPCTSEDKKPT